MNGFSDNFAIGHLLGLEQEDQEKIGYDDFSISNSKVCILYVDPMRNLVAFSGDIPNQCEIVLTWEYDSKDLTDKRIGKIIIRGKLKEYPQDINDGFDVYAGDPTATSCVVSNLEGYTEYYFRAFLLDGSTGEWNDNIEAYNECNCTTKDCIISLEDPKDYRRAVEPEGGSVSMKNTQVIANWKSGNKTAPTPTWTPEWISVKIPAVTVCTGTVPNFAGNCHMNVIVYEPYDLAQDLLDYSIAKAENYGTIYDWRECVKYSHTFDGEGILKYIVIVTTLPDGIHKSCRPFVSANPITYTIDANNIVNLHSDSTIYYHTGYHGWGCIWSPQFDNWSYLGQHGTYSDFKQWESGPDDI